MSEKKKENETPKEVKVKPITFKTDAFEIRACYEKDDKRPPRPEKEE